MKHYGNPWRWLSLRQPPERPVFEENNQVGACLRFKTVPEISGYGFLYFGSQGLKLLTLEPCTGDGSWWQWAAAATAHLLRPSCCHAIQHCRTTCPDHTLTRTRHAPGVWNGFYFRLRDWEVTCQLRELYLQEAARCYKVEKYTKHQVKNRG